MSEEKSGGEKSKEQLMKEMDEAGAAADVELRAMPHKDSIPVARWFAAHYMKAGHKRLGRAIVAFAKETKDLTPAQYGVDNVSSPEGKGKKK